VSAVVTRTATQERHAITAYIRQRIASVAKLAKHGRLTEADAYRLRRWLGALADDIDAQLYDDLPAEADS
jgi:argininosuccinate lyase